ncbi:MAG TPA: acetate--CoA ligase family protein [Candidatus Dormibacteraeota bacterium]|nr:acetate--CoA ligase family protein [Candidatus Dormibacteraeota bacterium]
MERLLRPRTIALVGASASESSLGASVLENLESAEYSGKLYLINPKRPTIQGHRCLGSIEELPANVDCAVLAIPAASVVESARACASKGVRSLVIFSAGFAEAGVKGQETQGQLAEIARESGMILQGPNCLGTVNYVDGIPLTFVSTPTQPHTEAPGAAIISQSGALVAVIAVNMRHYRIPLTYSVSTGNEASLGVEDFVDHLIGDKRTRVLVLIVEQFRQPRRFLELAQRARAAGQFIVLLHPGRSKAARVSAATHTGAIAGDYEVMRTLVTRSGVIHVESMEELLDVSQLLVHCSELPKGGPAIFTDSGAFKAIALDLCDRLEVDLPQFSSSTVRVLKNNLPPFIPISNPLDLTAQALVNPALYRETLSPVLDDDRVGSIMLGTILTDAKTTATKLPLIADAIRTFRPNKPVIFAALDEGACIASAVIEQMHNLGVPWFPSPERAIRALAHIAASPQVEGINPNTIQLPTIPDLFKESGCLSEYKSKQVLSRIGISTSVGRLAKTEVEALHIAKEVGFPVALKAQSTDLPHKSEAGGVVLGIESDLDLAEAWSSLHRNLERKRPGLRLEGVLVEKMGEKGVELILGARNDSQWGPVLLIGFGGVLAEAIKDIRLLPPDLPITAIEEELMKLRCSPLLRGFRGSPALDVGSAAEAVYRLGHLIKSCPEIAEVDVNPLVVYAEGRGSVALDALISMASRQPANITTTR